MRTGLFVILMLSAAAVVPTASIAETNFRVSVRTGHAHRSNWRPTYVRPTAYRPYRYWRPAYQTVYVTQPVYAAPPEPVVVDPTLPTLSGNYGNDWSDLHERINRGRAVVERQYADGSLSQAEHDRLLNAFDDLSRDARAKAFDRGGTLNASDFADLYRRLNQTNEDLQLALAR